MKGRIPVVCMLVASARVRMWIMDCLRGKGWETKLVISCGGWERSCFIGYGASQFFNCRRDSNTSAPGLGWVGLRLKVSHGCACTVLRVSFSLSCLQVLVGFWAKDCRSDFIETYHFFALDEEDFDVGCDTADAIALQSIQLYPVVILFSHYFHQVTQQGRCVAEAHVRRPHVLFLRRRSQGDP